jgi:ABC-type multidrug transport system ATPase subunit
MAGSDTVSTLREALEADLKRGLGQLAVLVSDGARDRRLVARTVLLQRELRRTEEEPTREQIDRALAILSDFAADQEAIAVSGAPSRRDIVDAARSRALAIEVPKAVVLECGDLSASYQRRGFTLSRVSFAIRYGEIAGVVGRNATGKTTLFRVLTGELKPQSGVIRFPALDSDGTSPRWPRIRQQIAYVPQVLPVWHGSLRSNLHYEAAIHGVPAADNVDAVEYIVERLGLRDELDRRWTELSGGFQLRFALARALVWRPRLLILDEPLANLDPFVQQIVLSDLRHLADSLRFPLAVLVSSQDLEAIEEVSDKLLILTKGQMTFFGPIEDIGRDRRVNRFEMSGRHLGLIDLEELFADIDYRSLNYNGLAFVLTTSRDVTPEMVLGRLSESRLPITFFRDISRSAKNVLQSDGLRDAAVSGAVTGGVNAIRRMGRE